MLDKLIQHVAYPLWDFREGGIRLKEYRRLHQAQWDLAAERRRYQQDRLRSILTHAYETVPYYRSAWSRNRLDTVIRDPGRLSGLPVLCKKDVRNSRGHLISDRTHAGKLIGAKTGGSTGVSLDVRFDARCQQLRNGAEMWANDMAGWRPGTLVGALWGSPPIPATLKEKIRSTFHDRVFYLDTMHLDLNSMGDFLQKVAGRHAKMLFGHAHSLYELAIFARQNSVAIPELDGIVATSMMLLDYQRNAIEAVFGTRVTDRYGCEEVGLIACEAPECGVKHLNTDHLVVEILDEADEPVASGETGRIVLTDLNNFGMPFIRYDVGDVGAVSTEPCDCGRGLPCLDRLVGRTADYFLHPDGSRVSGVSLVEKTLTAIDGLEQLQLIQESPRRISAKAVATGRSEVQVSDELRNALAAAFGDGMTADVEFVDRLDRSASGKYRFAICRIDHEHA